MGPEIPMSTNSPTTCQPRWAATARSEHQLEAFAGGRRWAWLVRCEPGIAVRGEVLSVSKKKSRRAARKPVDAPGAEVRPVAPGLEPLAILPGALMYRRPYPPGIPDPHSARSAHLHAAAAAPAFASIPSDERAALFESLGRSYRRSEYHWLRFLDLLKELPARREEMPGQVFWDEFVEFVYFEAQAFCGAARALLDEVVYLIARVHGVPPKKARKDPWETSNLVTAQSLATACQVPEVSILRASASWFGRLNAYRNSFFHHGWRHGAGHFDAEDSRAATVDPAANALLIPDFDSLAGRAKPHEWTYHRSDTLDQIMKDLHEGLDAVLRGLCEGPWTTPEPPPGQKPRSEHPNMIVSLPVPVVYIVREEVAIVAFFTTEAKAKALAPGIPNVELVQLPAVESVVGQRAFPFSLRGLGEDLPAAVKSVKVLIDAVVADPDWRNISCTNAIDLDLDEVRAKPLYPVNLVVRDRERLCTWVRSTSHGWRA